MTNLPGSRPVVTLYVDPAVALLSDGSLSRFWGRFIAQFTLEFGRRRYAVVLDLAPQPDPTAAVDAQSYVVAGARQHYEVEPGDVPFGQLLIAPGVHPLVAPGVQFAHDAAAIADDVLAALPDIQELMVVGDHRDRLYAQRIIAELRGRIPVREVSATEAATARTDQGVLSFLRDEHEVADLIAAAPAPLRLVHQSEPFTHGDAIVFLDLLGGDCGSLVAAAVADALDGEQVGPVTLPHRLVTTP